MGFANSAMTFNIAQYGQPLSRKHQHRSLETRVFPSLGKGGEDSGINVKTLHDLSLDFVAYELDFDKPGDWVAAATLLPGLALAHSHIPYIIINGEQFPGHVPKTTNNPPNIVGWTANNTDDGPVNATLYSDPDIICHRAATPATAHAPVRAGDSIHIQWNGWPASHVGPALTYLARCEGQGGCAGVDKQALSFFKIDDSAPALLDQSSGPPGRWASDVVIANNNSWTVTVPKGTAPGAYVMRHELIALHFAARKGGAQNYPLCLNLWVLGQEDGAEGASWRAGALGYGQGVPATDMYRSDDPGVDIDVAVPRKTYAIPGPTVVGGAAPIRPADQTKSIATAYGTPVAIVSGTATVPMPMGVTFVPGPRW
ncbi:hypothetical protein MCOR28_007763 [Pyricularia oryzae]|nr:hypothetical protein MCOR19_009013 [Pyricularia oryzae]KAI6266588.1 hypothetical protein MCOR26_010108 [Pyricularia oryzae]KAI6338624.1 hypothetical protein MCOR28_007763 [Pyricularia oryzae]KAI6470078.1 hypothetical protein MCOR15_001499 [Pyricularia oryzae]KAI6478043.1 hypothetical protein MCOR18_006428 [Pyricularia oryzae]